MVSKISLRLPRREALLGRQHRDWHGAFLQILKKAFDILQRPTPSLHGVESLSS